MIVTPAEMTAGTWECGGLDGRFRLVRFLEPFDFYNWIVEEEGGERYIASWDGVFLEWMLSPVSLRARGETFSTQH